MTRRLWQLHSWLGLLCGVALLVIGLTGSIIVFSAEVDKLLHPALTRVEPRGERLAWDQLLQSVHRALPAHEVIGWPRSAAPDVAERVRVRKRGETTRGLAFLNPYTGEVLGSGQWRDTVSGWLVELHYSLFLGDWGIVLFGLVAAGLCLLGLSGVWLYRGFWRSLFTLRWGKSRRILFSDLHKTIGICSVPFNLVLGFTGAWWNLQSLPSLWRAEPEPVTPLHRLYANSISIDALVAAATHALPGLDVSETYVTFPRAAGEPFRVSGRSPGLNFLHSPYGSEVTLDAHTGSVLAVQDLRQMGFLARVEDTFGPLHYGTFGGWPIKLLWCLGGLAPGALAVLGFLVWQSRRRPDRPHRHVPNLSGAT